MLTGAWRSSPPNLDLSPSALNLVAEKLLISRAGALAWWRIQYSDLRETAAAIALRNAYRLFTLNAALHDHKYTPQIFQDTCGADVDELWKQFVEARTKK